MITLSTREAINLLKLLTNIAILAAVLIGAWIFYPDAFLLLRAAFEFLFELVSATKLWPIVIIALLVAMLTRRR